MREYVGMITQRIFSYIFLSVVSGLGLFVIPQRTAAQVVINEIAWMGTSASANAEWIELHNQSADLIDMGGWVLEARDGAPHITLSGILQGSGYYILERTSDATLPSITASQIYTGSLGNTGEYLELKDSTGSVIDTVDATGEWLAGNNETKETMQRYESQWITAPATPGNGTLPPASDDDENNDDSEVDTPESSNNSSTSSKTITHKASSVEIIQIKPDPKYTAKVILPTTPITVGSVIQATVEVTESGKKDLVKGKFHWYMGDGKDYVYFKNQKLEHTYYYPGDYTVVLEYYSSEFKTEPDTLFKKKITVGDDDLSISGMTDDGGVRIENNSSQEIDLGDWTIVQGNNLFRFPKYTTIKKLANISISRHVIGFMINQWEPIFLYNPSKRKASERILSDE